ncbi:MAG TPA: DUF2066 domain-containing protein [Azospirillum sp.]|nr:DUF2066 domain-containing protein [Azospirillum sp.]
MLHRRCRPLCAGLAALLVVSAGLAAPSGAQTPVAGAAAPATQADAFTVSGVKVDVSAANANEARNQAISEAQRNAWDTLYQRMAAGRRTPHVSDIDLARLVQGFEIDEEKVAATRYVGSITVHFRPQAVRDHLANAGTAFVEPPMQPLVVLPVTVVGGRPVLWEDRTRWREAWEAHERGNSLVPLAVPEGEMEDLQAIGVEDAVNGTPEPVAAIAQRYKASGVVVAKMDLPASGEPTRGQPLVVEVTRYNLDGTHENQTVPVKIDPNDRPEDVLARAVTFVAAALDEGWRRENTVASGPEQSIAVAVPVTRLEDWIETRKRLATVNVVSRVDVLSLSRVEALVGLTFRGDVERLRQALARRDLGLTEAAPRMTAGTTPGPAMELRVLPRGSGAALATPPLPTTVTTPSAPPPANPGVVMGAPPRNLGTLPAHPAPPVRY